MVRAVVDVVAPGTGQLVDQVGLLAEEHVPDVVSMADRAFRTWSATPLRHRQEVLHAMADALTERIALLAKDYSEQHGKLVHEAQIELERAVDTIHWVATSAGSATRPRDLPPRPGLAHREVRVDPAGPVLAMVPWNYAAVILARKVAPALAMGCSVIVKGPEETPCVARAFQAAAEDAGCSPGTLQTVFAEPAVVQALVRSPRLRQISFTGSTRVGRIIATLAAEHLTPCVLELGGHAPVIVTADADLDLAVRTLVAAKFAATGQSCGSPSRFLLDRRIHDEFVERFCDRLDDHPMGPLNSARRREHVHGLVSDAVRRSAVLRRGGTLPSTPGFYYPATVLTDIPADAAILTEEPFGPVAPMLRYDDDDTAVDMANSTTLALSAYVFGDIDHAAALAARIDAGGVTLNAVPTAFPDAPLGGRHDSGYGYEGGDEGLLAFGRLKILQTGGDHG
ncbi:aldehyde dehydrogenase family protein [Actinophytocola sp.]|uniref:aldehyde dehydrogenase family protein n=1 Tax=Actinophytocola sp. TaxID=1872138 RepID=UPI003D6C5358